MDTPRTEPQQKAAPRGEPQRETRIRRVTSLDLWLDDAMEWIGENAPWTLGTLGVLILSVGVVCGVYEWRASHQTAAQAALAAVDRELGVALAPGAQPANEATAKDLREKALAGYEAVIRDHGDRFGGQVAVIRAAEQEIELGKVDAAEKRLAEVIAEWPEQSVQRAVALRLRGYALERLDHPAEAAQAYAQAAAVEAYPGRAGSYAQAAETFARIGDTERAIAQYEALTVVDAGYAERMGVVDRLQTLRAGTGQPAAATAPAASSPPASGATGSEAAPPSPAASAAEKPAAPGAH